MKQGIHPKYYNEAKVKCACGAEFLIGSTEPEIHVEICSACHPFYTGKQKLLDSAGRVDKFKAKMEAAKKAQAAKVEKKNNKSSDKNTVSTKDGSVSAGLSSLDENTSVSEETQGNNKSDK